MTAIDRQQIIEDTAKAIHDALCIFHRDGRTQIGCYGVEQRSETDAMLTLPVIVAAVLKPIRELHAAGEPVCVETGHTPSRCPCSEVFCEGCGESMPCPTVRLLDEIESSAKGGE